MNQGNVWFAKGKLTKAMDLYDNAEVNAESEDEAKKRLIQKIESGQFD